jgi:hypothetical protein
VGKNIFTAKFPPLEEPPTIVLFTGILYKTVTAVTTLSISVLNLSLSVVPPPNVGAL